MDVRNVLFITDSPTKVTKDSKHVPINNTTVTIDGIGYVQYNIGISTHILKSMSSLVNSGANGDITGDDAHHIVTLFNKTAIIIGIANHQLSSIIIITTGGIFQFQQGSVIMILQPM